VIHVRVTAIEAAAIAMLAGKGGVSRWMRHLIQTALAEPPVRDTPSGVTQVVA